MKIAGILQPGTSLGYVVEGKHVRGSLIVCQTLAERDALLSSGVLVNGTPVYVADTGISYTYEENKKLFTKNLTLVEDENGVLCTKGEDGSLEKVKFLVTTEDLDPELKDKLTNATTPSEVQEIVKESLVDYVTTDSLNKVVEQISNLGDQITQLNLSKQDKLTAGKNITIENNIISAMGFDIISGGKA